MIGTMCGVGRAALQRRGVHMEGGYGATPGIASYRNGGLVYGKEPK